MSEQSDALSRFVRQLADETPKVKAELVKGIRKIALDMLTGCVLGTRVDTGRARGGWQLGVNHSPEGETGILGTEGQVAGVVISNGEAKLKTAPADLGDSYYVSNNVEYISHLDEKDRIIRDTVETLVARYPENLRFIGP